MGLGSAQMVNLYYCRHLGKSGIIVIVAFLICLLSLFVCTDITVLVDWA